jgi:hypothetical protein
VTRIDIDRAHANAVAARLAATWIRRPAWEIELGARRMVRKKTYAVHGSIRARPPVITAKRVTSRIEATHRRALLEHYGAKPHPITPRSPYGILRFYWDKVGYVVHFMSVQHPGTRGSYFLTTPMLRVAQKWGFTKKQQIRPGGASGKLTTL